MKLCVVSEANTLPWRYVRNVHGAGTVFCARNAVRHTSAGKRCFLMYVIHLEWEFAAIAGVEFILINLRRTSAKQPFR